MIGGYFYAKKSKCSRRWKDVLIRHYEHKKRNEYPFPVARPYAAKNSFLSWVHNKRLLRINQEEKWVTSNILNVNEQ